MGPVLQLYGELRPALLRYVARFVGDADLAEDVVQETFLRLEARPPEDDRNLRGWIFTVATNLARDHLRTAQHRDRLARSAAARLPAAAPPVDPADRVERTEERTRVRAALAALSAKERTALLMREEGFKHREIADAVGTTTKSVGTLIARALGKMARHLTGETES